VHVPRVRRVLHGVVQQIPQRIRQRFAIAGNLPGLAIDLKIDARACRGSLLLELLDHRAYERARIERFEAVRRASRFEPPEIEETLYEPVQPIGGRFVSELQMPGLVHIAAAALVLVAAAILASVTPAARAARVDVVRALRTD
jgi:hypothetical protein